MPRTALTERLGLRHPIVQAPMGGVAGPELADAVARAGALGMLTAGAPPRARPPARGRPGPAAGAPPRARRRGRARAGGDRAARVAARRGARPARHRARRAAGGHLDLG